MEPLLEVLAGQALERALAEALEERELAALRARQAAYQQACRAQTQVHDKSYVLLSLRLSGNWQPSQRASMQVCMNGTSAVSGRASLKSM